MGDGGGLPGIGKGRARGDKNYGDDNGSKDGDREGTDGGKDDDDAHSKESVFGKMKTLEEVAAEQQAKKDEKKKMLTKLKAKRDNMRPLIVFTGVKDNPLPYEQKYLRTQA